MIESWSGRAACAALLLAAAPLGAQDLPRPAAESIEVEISATATAEVPAQAYRLAGFFLPGGQGAPAATIPPVEPFEMPDRQTCLPDYPMGFIGNEVFPPEVEGDAPEQAAPDEAGDGAVFRAPKSYSGLFATRAAAEKARGLLAGERAGSLMIQPVLFDCAAVLEQATLAALGKSQAEAETLARALGMRNAGAVGIDVGEGEQALLLTVLRNAGSNGAADAVQAAASLTVTYRFVK
jgi:hypothetical protein